jgi:hypothetical protein
MTAPKFYTQTLYEVAAAQGAFLLSRTAELIEQLDQLYEIALPYVKSHNAKALILVFPAQGDYFFHPWIIAPDGEFVYLTEIDEGAFYFDDGKAFGLRDYPYEIEEHPTEDSFQMHRTLVLNQFFYAWVLEGVWNSKLLNFPVHLLYSHNPDHSKITDLKTDMEKYEGLDFLNDDPS